MKRKSEHEIMAALQPEEIFSMDPSTIEQEKEEYINRFRPTEYRTIQNFLVTRKVLLLYEQALETISNGSYTKREVLLKSTTGEEYNIHYINTNPFKLGKCYLTRKAIIYVVEGKYKSYYENYIEKTKNFLKPNEKIWNYVRYMLPNVKAHFETVDGNFVIMLEKPAEDMYSLRELLEYFGGSIKAEYVASILTRLYYFANYMSRTETTHNAITVDNLWFKPGRQTEEGEKYTIDDLRIVGVYGGWFFTTYFYEQLKGVPKEVYDVLPEVVKVSKYSSFEVDALSIKSVAKELLGNGDIPNPLKEWIETSLVAKDPYDEFRNWEIVIIESFGKRRFVNMDVDLSK